MSFPIKKIQLYTAVIIFCLLSTGCSGKSPPSQVSSVPASLSDTSGNPRGSRDNTPEVLVPSADGLNGSHNEVVSLDTSHLEEGYVMADYFGTNPKVKLQLLNPDGLKYTYTLHGGYETFPLTGGSGTYNLKVYENVTEDQYSLAFSADFSANITNEFGPYLYPNQYVNFSSEMTAVSKGAELAESADTDLDVVASVYNYITSHIVYDKAKADTVESGYLPSPDETLASGKGICFDYAALMATMLRSQRIPTRLEVGYAGTAYHAWVSVYITDIGWLNGIIQFDGSSWEMVDPTLGASDRGDEDIKQFIGDGSSYQTKYVY